MINQTPLSTAPLSALTADHSSPLPADSSPAGGNDDSKKARKDKVRSAWISFVGRILAQVIGAAASIVFGVIILNKVQHGADRPAGASSQGVVPAPQALEESAPIRARHGDDVAIAVLPLENLSGDPQQDYLADGLTEALTTSLAQRSGLRVISRTSAMRYKAITARCWRSRVS